MIQALLHGLGAIFLGWCLWLGHRRWIAPHGAALGLGARGLLVLLLVTLWGGFVGAPFWWAGVRGAFAWPLPTLAGRMLAAAGWAFALLTFLTLQRPSRRRVRLFLLLLATYLAPLVVAIVIFHRDRFDFHEPITYDFFAIAGGLAVAALSYLLRQPTIMPDAPEDALPTSPLVRSWLGLVAALTAPWGLALFATDRGPWSALWVWPGDLLTSRLIGVMLLTIAVGAAASLRHADLAWVMLLVGAAYGLGVALASLAQLLGGKPLQPSYLVAFGLLALGSALLVRAPAPRPAFARSR